MTPIKNIKGVVIPTPSKYELGSQDISKPGAGRTIDGKMHKRYLTRKLTVALSWNYLTLDEAKKLLNITSDEYFVANVLDTDGTFKDKTFYRGDVKGNFYGEPVNAWTNLSFNLIER